MIRLLAHPTYRLLRALDRPARDPLSEGKGSEGSDKRGPAGVALVIALMTIAILSAAVVEYAYATRVNLKMSVNSRDKLKSYFLARSGVNISRLMLNFQYALQNEADSAEDGQSAGGSCNPGMISTAMRRSNFQMYQYMDLLMKPFNNGRLETPVGGIDLSGAGVQGFGKINGKFDVDIEPEEGKLNINRFARSEVRQQDLTDFCALIGDSQYTDIFRKDDEKGEVLDQFRILQYAVDYIDLNDTELPLTEYCTLEGAGNGDEGAPYADSDLNIEPRNAMLTHPAELYQVYGVSEEFMRAFGEQLTTYPIGKPNANSATTPVFYSVLCRNVQFAGNGQAPGSTEDGQQSATLCQTSPQIAMQVLLFAMALDGVRNFFKDPLSVLMAYVGTTESRLLPSAKKGQPVAFLRSSQVHSYLQDFKNNPQLMAQFLTYSPTYQRLAMNSRQMQFNPQNPNFPQWIVDFDRTGILRAVTTQTPSIYRIKATGTYGTTETTIETVIDFNKPVRRLPDQQKLENRESDPEQVKQLKEALNKRQETMPKGRVYFWRENVMQTVDDTGEDRANLGGPGAGFGSDAGGLGGQQGGFGDDQPGGGFGDDDNGFGDGNQQGGGGFGNDQQGGGGFGFGN